MPEGYSYFFNLIIQRGARMASEWILLTNFSSREQSKFLRKCANMENLECMPLKSIYTFSESLESVQEQIRKPSMGTLYLQNKKEKKSGSGVHGLMPWLKVPLLLYSGQPERQLVVKQLVVNSSTDQGKSKLFNNAYINSVACVSMLHAP